LVVAGKLFFPDQVIHADTKDFDQLEQLH
jgi:hypothetical protein